MPRVFSLVFSVVLAAVLVLPARADDAADFMQRFSGAWIGSGQLLFGTVVGTEFACELNGDPSATRLTFGMTGRCWMGALSAPVDAQLRYNAETNEFYGDFMGGAEGNGVDLVGMRAGGDFSLRLTRGSEQGRLALETIGPNEMKAVIYYRDPRSKTELPVAAMGFTRKEVITGSIAGN